MWPPCRWRYLALASQRTTTTTALALGSGCERAREHLWGEPGRVRAAAAAAAAAAVVAVTATTAMRVVTARCIARQEETHRSLVQEYEVEHQLYL